MTTTQKPATGPANARCEAFNSLPEDPEGDIYRCREIATHKLVGTQHGFIVDWKLCRSCTIDAIRENTTLIVTPLPNRDSVRRRLLNDGTLYWRVRGRYEELCMAEDGEVQSYSGAEWIEVLTSFMIREGIE